MAYDPRLHGSLCGKCPLNGQTVVPPEHNLSDMERLAGVQVTVIVGESPGDQEERTGRPFVGPSGDELNKALRHAGIPRGKCLITNSCLCRPPGNDMKALLRKISKHNKDLTPGEEPIPSPIDCCAPRLEKEISGLTNFITLGGTATRAITGAQGSILALRGGLMELAETPEQPARKVMPTVHPAFVLRAQRWAHVFRNDLHKAGQWFRGETAWVPPAVLYNPPLGDLQAFFARHADEALSFDLETDGIEPLTAKLRCIGIGTETEVAVVGILGQDGYTKFYPPDEERRIINLLKQILTDKSIPKIAHNGKTYDFAVLRSQWGIETEPILDTILLHKSIESELPHSLAYVASLYTTAESWKSKNGRKLSIEAESDKELAIYCSNDVAITARVFPKLAEQVTLRNQVGVWQLDQKVQRICADMHAVGMFVNQNIRLSEEKRLFALRYKALNEVRDRLGLKEFNPGSVFQLRDVLFDRWKLEAPVDEEERFTASGDPSTADFILRAMLTGIDSLTDDQREVLKLIRKYRKTQKLLGTYVVKLRPSNVMAEGDIGWDDDDEEWEDKEHKKKYSERVGIVDPRTGRCYPGYSVTVPVTGRLSSSKPINCFDGETEILSELGWIRFDELKNRLNGTLRLAQWHEDGKIDWAVPLEYHEGQHDGRMIEFRHQSSDLLMTPNHRVPLEKVVLKQKDNAVRSTRRLETVEARQLITLINGYHTIHSGIGEPTRGIGVSLTDDEIRFIVAAQADGSVTGRENSIHGLDFGFTKERKIKRLRELMVGLGLEFTETESKPPKGSSKTATRKVRYFVRAAPLLNRLMTYIPTAEKHFGAWVLEMSPQQREVFISELFFWDGCHARQSQYACTVKSNAEWAQIVLALSGIRANLRYYKNDAGGYAWIVDVRRTTTNAITSKAEKASVHFKGTVYCVTMPSDAIVVRRRGKITITRQSQNFPKASRGMIVAQPGHVLVGADMDQLELRIAAARWSVKLYLRAFTEGKDPHSMTAFATFGQAFCDAAGIDPQCFKQPGILVGKDYDPTGKFIGKGESKKYRDLSKVVQYASQYEATAETVHKVVQKTEIENKDGTTDLPYAKLPLRKVREMRDAWLKGAPEFAKGWESEMALYRKQGFIAEPVTGRRRDFMDGENPNEISNFSIQGSAAGLMNLAIVPIWEAVPLHKWGPGTGIINQCHDSIVIECPEDKAEYCKNLLEEHMNSFSQSLPGVKFSASADIAHSWDKV